MVLPATIVILLTFQVCNSARHEDHKEVVVGSEPVRPLETQQALKFIRFWGATFKFSLDVLINSYETAGAQNIFGQLLRFKAENATFYDTDHPAASEAGFRVPAIYIGNDGSNRLTVYTYIDNTKDPKGPGLGGIPGTGNGPNNYEINFYDGNDLTAPAPKPKDWFTITISQRPVANEEYWRFKVEIKQKGQGKNTLSAINNHPIQFNNVTIYSTDQKELELEPNSEIRAADALFKNFYIWK